MKDNPHKEIIIPRQAKTRLEMLKKIIKKYKLNKKEINLLVKLEIELYQCYLFNWLKGFSHKERRMMIEKSNELRIK
mgnify:CR=1 FL=1